MKRLILLLLYLGLLLSFRTEADASSGPVCGPGQKLSMGVFPRRNPAMTGSMFGPMAEYLTLALGCPVELRTASDFRHFWAGVETGDYDLVHYNQYHYIKSAETYEVVAHNEEFGSGTIAGAIYTRRDSGIDKLDELVGKRIVFGGGPDAMMSHIVPRYLLLEAGITPDLHDTAYAPNPPNAVLAVFYGKTDAAGAGDVVIRLPVVTNSVDTGQLQIIATSEPIIHLPWSVRRSLPAATRQRIQTALLALRDDELGRAALKSAGMTGIAPAADRDYDNCRAIVRRVKAAFPFD